jgi:hypothetical protein
MTGIPKQTQRVLDIEYSLLGLHYTSLLLRVTALALTAIFIENAALPVRLQHIEVEAERFHVVAHLRIDALDLLQVRHNQPLLDQLNGRVLSRASVAPYPRVTDGPLVDTPFTSVEGDTLSHDPFRFCFKQPGDFFQKQLNSLAYGPLHKAMSLFKCPTCTVADCVHCVGLHCIDLL